MARLALLGAAVGPWVDISRINRPRLRVLGLPYDAELVVRFIEPDDARTVTADGVFPMPQAAWAQINCNFKNRHSTICKFESAKES